LSHDGLIGKLEKTLFLAMVASQYSAQYIQDDVFIKIENLVFLFE